MVAVAVTSYAAIGPDMVGEPRQPEEVCGLACSCWRRLPLLALLTRVTLALERAEAQPSSSLTPPLPSASSPPASPGLASSGFFKRRISRASSFRCILLWTPMVVRKLSSDRSSAWWTNRRPSTFAVWNADTYCSNEAPRPSSQKATSVRVHSVTSEGGASEASA